MLKAFYDYKQEIKNVSDGKQELTRYYDFKEKFHEKYLNATTKEERDAIHADFKQAMQERDAIQAKNAHVSDVVSYMNNNLKHVLFNCVIGTITKELNAVKNKRFGEKTRDAFKQAIKEKLNCVAYINGDVLTVITLDKNGYTDGYSTTINISCDGGYFDNNGKLKTFSVSDFSLKGVKPYINDNDIENVIQERENVKKAIQERETEINALIDKYNDLIINDGGYISRVYLRF